MPNELGDKNPYTHYEIRPWQAYKKDQARVVVIQSEWLIACFLNTIWRLRLEQDRNRSLLTLPLRIYLFRMWNLPN